MNRDYKPNRLREFRENALMTQAELAQKARVALRTIHSMEKGIASRQDTKRKVLSALGMEWARRAEVFPELALPKRSRTLSVLPPVPGSPQ